MKKNLSLSLVFSLLATGLFATEVANKETLVSIDSLRILQESKEGKLLSERLQKEIEGFQSEVKKAQTKVVDLQTDIQKQSKVLSKDALMEKGEELNRIKKAEERALADKEEVLKVKVQREQMTLREKQLKVTKQVFDSKGWGMMIDVNTPGVICSNKAIDKTPEILKAVDAAYEKDASGKVKTIKAA